MIVDSLMNFVVFFCTEKMELAAVSANSSSSSESKLALCSNLVTSLLYLAKVRALEHSS